MHRLGICLAACLCALLGPACRGVDREGTRPRHVFVIVLENKGFEETFGASSPAPYLAHELTSTIGCAAFAFRVW
jgi:hypothetical protein